MASQRSRDCDTETYSTTFASDGKWKWHRSAQETATLEQNLCLGVFRVEGNGIAALKRLRRQPSRWPSRLHNRTTRGNSIAALKKTATHELRYALTEMVSQHPKRLRHALDLRAACTKANADIDARTHP
jgi:hypothetical protein